MRLTQAIIYEKCRKFEVGDKIYIHRSERAGSGNHNINLKIPAVVIARYPTYILTEREHGIKECFTYAEIVTEGIITKRTGRPKKGKTI